MVLVDTSVWIDHLRQGGEDALRRLLETGLVLMHPYVSGELAMGSLRDRDTVLSLMSDLPQALVADHEEVLAYVSRHRLHGLGIGYIDAHLLASTRLTGNASLWTRDKRLRQVADDLDLGSHFE